MPFRPGNNANPAGRPRARITKFREQLADLTGDGKEIAEGLRAIYNDPASSKTERLKAYELALAYLLGKPEAAVSIDAEVSALPGRVIDIPALLARLPSNVIDAVVNELDDANPPLLPAATDEAER
jgi:hypothetical protein